ncbi:MAG: glycosyltransferase, partial [Candidatus Dadabacteria bacterium]
MTWKIAVVAPRIDRIGGAEQILLQDIEALASRPDVELTVVTTSVAPDVELPGHGRVIDVQPPRAPGLLGTLAWFRAADAALRRLGPGSFDRIYAPGINGTLATHVLLHACFAEQRELHRAARRARPWNARCQSRHVRFVALAAAERHVLAGPRPAVATVSPRAARIIEQHHGIEARVLPPIIDTRRFSPQMRAQLRAAGRAALELTDEDRLVVAVGNAWHSKGFDLLIAAAKNVGRPLRLALVTTERPTHLQRMCGPLPENVTLLPLRPDIEAWYAAADMVALPSRGETLGLPPLEAAAMGVPVRVSGEAGCAHWLPKSSVVPELSF